MPKSVEISPFGRAQGEGLVSNAPSEGARPLGRPPAGKELQWVEPFLDRIAAGDSIIRAAAKAGINPGNACRRRRSDAAFRDAWNLAASIATRQMEQEAQRRAYHGTVRPVYYKGVRCGSVREYSDTLLMFLLKGRKPQVYREGVEDGARPNVQISVVNVAGPAQPAPVAMPSIAVEVVASGGQA